ncbi:MAG: helix-turn-helix domain-containing protein [Candidatus Tenebribacter burtonii]|jgi:sugar-specific transcriptional regulator TrmB|nr:helix-turn-helix domain-containing protein [Candidatus Tenebribacter burtonii]
MNKYLVELMEVGLTENEAKVYSCLLQKHIFTATEISQCCNVNRSRIYSVLESLINKGLCIEKLGKIRRFQAASPDVAFDKLITEQNEKLKTLTSLTQLLTPIYKSNIDNSSQLEFIEVYGTPSSIIKKHHSLELESKEVVLSFCKSPYAMSNDLDIHEEQEESMKTGVVFKSIFEVEKDDIEFFVQRMKNFEDQGEEIKVAYHLPIKLHVFDDHTVMFSMINQVNPDQNLTYMVIEHSDLAETLITTFYKYWDEALTISNFLKKENITL